MAALAELQRTFQDFVLYPDGAKSTAWVDATGRAAPEIQLSVYTHAYSSRLKEVLANDFPAVLEAIGDSHFEQLAEDYLRAHPSRYFSLRDFGSHFANFVGEVIQRSGPYLDMLWLYELALFEWTLGAAFDAAGAETLIEQDIAAIPPEAWSSLRFTFHPSVHRLDFEWNIPRMWQALTAETPTQMTAVQDGGSAWLVWRERLVTRFRSLAPDEQRALDSLRAGDSLDTTCALLAGLMPAGDVPLRAASLLKGWLAQGLISEILE